MTHFHERGMTVKCPRCNRTLYVPLGHPDVECNCHLYCPEGDKPSDCSVTVQNYSGGLGYPVGLNNNPENKGHDVMNRTYYCSTHTRYYYKTPIIINVDWERWYRSRAPEELRLGQGNY